MRIVISEGILTANVDIRMLLFYFPGAIFFPLVQLFKRVIAQSFDELLIKRILVYLTLCHCQYGFTPSTHKQEQFKGMEL